MILHWPPPAALRLLLIAFETPPPPPHTHQLSTEMSNPIVFFDMTIGGAPAGRIEMTLRADVVPRTAEVRHTETPKLLFRLYSDGEPRLAPRTRWPVR